MVSRRDAAGGSAASGPARGRARFPAALPGNAPAAAAPALRAATGVPAASGLGLDSGAVRQAMVARLAQQGIDHPQVLQAMAQVERHRFVEPALVVQAYEDTSLPIGWGQTISKPSVVARMLALLCAGRRLPLGRVLEIGTGCGYQAAVLSHLCQEVYSVERLRALHERARVNLRPLRIPNLHLILGDGMLGYPQGAPYAGIIAAAGGTELPQAWLQQLAPGGRLVAPAELQAGQQSLVVIERTASGFERRVLEPVRFVPLKSGLA
jgi:protein-L-isoaspartate(D-aspartate) O-methyltransferase